MPGFAMSLHTAIARSARSFGMAGPANFTAWTAATTAMCRALLALDMVDRSRAGIRETPVSTAVSRTTMFRQVHAALQSLPLSPRRQEPDVTHMTSQTDRDDDQMFPTNRGHLIAFYLSKGFCADDAAEFAETILRTQHIDGDARSELPGA